MDIQNFADKALAWLLTSGVQILIIFILLAVAMRVANLLTNKLLERWQKCDDTEFLKRKDTLGGIIQKALTTVIVLVGAMMILDEIGIKVGPILAAAGVLGLAVGFGAQKLVEDVITGFFILWGNQIRKGDVVQVSGIGGFVEDVNLRMVILRDLSGNVHYVRNGKIDVVTNMTKNFSYYVFDIGVSYRENVDEVIGVIREVDEKMRGEEPYSTDILEPIEILGLDKFADSAVVIKARTKTKPIRQWAVGREFNRRLKMAFDERGIEIPFPHLTLYMGQDKQGQAPPLVVKTAATDFPGGN